MWAFVKKNSKPYLMWHLKSRLARTCVEQASTSRRRKASCFDLRPLRPGFRMLCVEASGTCDICFERFRGEPGCLTAPHSIPCGHVFCKTYVRSVLIVVAGFVLTNADASHPSSLLVNAHYVAIRSPCKRYAKYIS